VWARRGRGDDRATLIIFLFRLSQPASLARPLPTYRPGVWLLLMAGGVAVDLQRAGRCRRSRAFIAHRGGDWLPAHPVDGGAGSDRAVMLIPTWFLLVVWVVAAGGGARRADQRHRARGFDRRSGAIVMLSASPLCRAGSPAAARRGRARRRRAARAGDDRKRDAIFDWNVPPTTITSARDRVAARPQARRPEGLRGWLDILHPLDRDRFSAALEGAAAALGSHRPRHRLRGADSRYHSFTLKARPVVNAAGECQGDRALSDVHRRSRPPKSASFTTRSTTISPACPIANCSSTVGGRSCRPTVRRTDACGAGDRRRPFQGDHDALGMAFGDRRCSPRRGARSRT